jgi:hypothetical protein
MTAYAEARPAPSAELRTSLGLVTLAAALAHVMGASHDIAVLPSVVMAVLQGGFAAALIVWRAPWAAAPAAAVDAMIALVWIVTRLQGLPVYAWDIVATVTEVAAVGGTVALLLGRGVPVWSKVVLAVFALAAFTGFGHVGH